MNPSLGIIIANFRTSLSSKVVEGDIAAVLTSNLDKDGVAIPNGNYHFLIDKDSTNEEHIQCTVTNNDISSVMHIPRQGGAMTVGFKKSHGVAADVILTDFANLKIVSSLSKGEGGYPNLIKYASNLTPTIGQYHLASWDFVKTYIDGIAIAGSPLATIAAQGIVELATTAQIDSETALGETGAAIVLTPDNFANSKYGPLVRAQSTPNMTVAVKAFGIAELTYAGGNTGTIIAPVTNPRIDLVVLTSAGALAVRAGAEGVSPVAPTPTDGDVVLAKITLETSTTSITNTLISNYVVEKYVAPTSPTQLYKTWIAGQAITAGDALVFNYFVQPLGRILFDTSASVFHGGVNNPSYAVVIGSGTNRILLVDVSSTGTITGVTYGGTAMTLISTISQSGYICHRYKLLAPATGSNTLLISGTTIQGSAYQSFSNVDQVTNVEVFSTAVNGGGSGFSFTITPLSPCAFVSSSLFSIGGGGSMATNTVTYNSMSALNKTNSGVGQGDITTSHSGYVGNPQVITCAGAIQASSGPSFIATIQVALKPANPVASPRVIKASAANPTDLNNLTLTNLLGFARTSAAAEANVDVVYGGVASGLAGLNQNTHYFLSNTAGAIATTAGTNSKKVGLAVSATELLIKNENA